MPSMPPDQARADALADIHSSGSATGKEDTPFLSLRLNRTLGVLASILVCMYGFVVILVPDDTFSDDSYFYFQVAWNFARGMGSTFNNIMPTNGYHPLWMLVCAAVLKVFPFRPHAIHAIAGVIVTLDVLTMLTVRRILQFTGRDLWPVALTLLVPFCFLSQLGTEGALSGLLLALTALQAYRLLSAPDSTHAVLFNLLAALAVLSRLDNIFIITFLWLAVTSFLWSRNRWLQIAPLPIYALLWGGYLATNRIYFHIWQPISGMLKSNSISDHRLGANLPHNATVSFAIIVVCTLGLALKKRDLFFRRIELPWAAGIVCHGLYITFKMSTETRWSWYYTSWMLLASIMMARLFSVLLERKRTFAAPLCALCVLLIAVLWVRGSYRNTYKGMDMSVDPNFNQVVYTKAGVHRALAYDRPGQLAFYSDIQIIPLDGLMGDMQFQTELARVGVMDYIKAYHIDGFLGPADNFPLQHNAELCDRLYLYSVKFHCEATPGTQGLYHFSSVDVFSRVPAAPAGTLPLTHDEIVWTSSGDIAVWKFK